MKDKDFTSYNIENIYHFRFRTKKNEVVLYKKFKKTQRVKKYIMNVGIKNDIFLQLAGF